MLRRRGFLLGTAASPSLGLAGTARAVPPADGQAAGAGAAAVHPPAPPVLLSPIPAPPAPAGSGTMRAMAMPPGQPSVARFTWRNEDWSVHERRHGDAATLWFVRADGRTLTLPRRLETCGAGPGPFYAGMAFRDVALAGRDLLAEHLLAGGGDPDPAAVRDIAPPVASRPDPAEYGPRLLWTFFLGTPQSSDTMPVTPAGSTRNWHVDQAIPGLTNTSAMVAARREGFLGGWLPALVKRFPIDATRFWEVMLFADMQAEGAPLTPSFQRVCLVDGATVRETRFFGSYPAFGPDDARDDALGAPPTAEAFYAALLVFTLAWHERLSGGAELDTPDPSWADMGRHAFARELMTRPGGVYPRYGAVDRDYVGSEYDGFQDTFTSSLLANLDWGRFRQARLVLDNFLSAFVLETGLARMRGTEVGQTGLGLSLIAHYALLTDDLDTVRRHRTRIGAMAALLVTLHERSLALPASDPGHGLLHGWSESDSCLFPDPSLWWKPYFSNSALAVRGFADLAAIWTRIDPADGARAADWDRRGRMLRRQLDQSMRASIRHDLAPPYVPIMPGTRETFRESLQRHVPSEQQWPHRIYAELLQSGALAPDLEIMVIECMRAHGATSLGVVANIGPPDPESRDMLGFISYGYARALLRNGRIPEYLLFLYSHRYHLHTPGSWTAAEVAGLRGELPLFCIPAQMTIPILLRWMMVFEHDDADVLQLCAAVPTAWLLSTDGISIRNAPTRWGPVSVAVRAATDGRVLTATLSLPPDAPARTHLVLRHGLRSRPGQLRAGGADARMQTDADSTTITLSGIRPGRVDLTLQLSPAP